MSRQLCRRVGAIEHHLFPAGRCPVCGGKGYLIVRIDGKCPGGPSEKGNPCPSCGESIVVEVVMTDQITPRLEQAETA